jgi:hypothetical protein
MKVVLPLLGTCEFVAGILEIVIVLIAFRMSLLTVARDD